MVRGGGGAQRGHGIIDAMLRQCHYIHVSFHHHHPPRLADRLACAEQVIELTAFLEQRCFGRIEIFGLTLLQHAPTETHNHPFLIEDRKHDAIAETVIAFTIVVLNHQPCLNQRIRRHSCLVIRKDRSQILPAGRCVTNRKAGSGLARQAAFFQISNGTLGMLELFPIKPCGGVHHFKQIL